MNHAAAIVAVNRALAHFRDRQVQSPAEYAARENVQMSMLAEYLPEVSLPFDMTAEENQSIFWSDTKYTGRI